MIVFGSGEDSHTQKKRYKASSSKGDQIGLNGLYADSNCIRRNYEPFPDMLSRLKETATDPCNPRASSRSVRQKCAQILNARKVLILTTNEFPWKKRKLDKLLSSVSTAPSDVISAKSEQSFTGLTPHLVNCGESVENFNQPIISKILSSPVTSLKSGDNLQGNQVPIDSSFKDNEMDWSSLPNCEFPPLIDSDESMNDINTSNSEKPILQDPFLLDLYDSANRSNPSTTEKQVQWKCQIPRRSRRLLNFIGDYLPRMAIPIGPRFQADIPDWTGPPSMENLYSGDGDLYILRRLGTRTWPTKGGMAEITGEVIGKGRPDSCLCISSGSTECIKHHIMEERLRLQFDLGPAFLSWKFDEMGEEVSKFWTFKDQRTFKCLMKLNPNTRCKSFWKLAIKRFPSKCKKSLVSYYYNVFIPRHLSIQTRPESVIMDGDDDNPNEALASTYYQRRCQTECINLGDSQDLKTRLVEPY